MVSDSIYSNFIKELIKLYSLVDQKSSYNMSKEEFLSLNIGVKVINKQGIKFKVAWQRNKDKWALTKGSGVQHAFIHKDNFYDYELAK